MITVTNENNFCIITLANSNGMSVKVTPFGATLLQINVPDKEGNLENVILEYAKIEDYKKQEAYFGAVCGRVAGRIDKGLFALEGTSYKLAKNWNGISNLHGGTEGFSFKKWQYETMDSPNNNVRFTYKSKHMEEGFPGNLKAEVIYTLKEDNSLQIDYIGVSDKTTVLNLTNHAYFNLSGNAKRTIEDEELMLNASQYINVNERLVAGTIESVENTAMDFKTPKCIGRDIECSSLQNHPAAGYDHPFLLDKGHLVNARLYDKKSGRLLEVRTTYPAIVVYSANYVEGIALTNNVIAKKYHGICLETQNEPNGINDERFNDSVIQANEISHHTTVFSFSVV